MKVIIIKECKDGKVNDVIDVSAGYATNFLIRQKLALPLNSKTEHMLKNKINNIEVYEKSIKDNALRAKKVIDSLILNFKLKVTNMVVHGSITKKQINKELTKRGLKIDSHLIENIKITTLGITNVKIKLHKEVKAELKVEVKNEK